MLLKMPHKPKGSSSTVIKDTGYQWYLKHVYPDHVREKGGEEDAGGLPQKDVAFSLFKGRKSSVFFTCFKNVIFSVSESVKAGPRSTLNLKSHTKPVLFSFFSTWYEKEKKSESDRSASLLVRSPRQCPHWHQHFVYSLTVMLCLFLWGTHQHTDLHADSHSLLETKRRERW